MAESLWQLLQEDPSNLSCDECFAVMEYYAELLARGGTALLPEVMKHLEGCPSCRTEHRVALERLARIEGESDGSLNRDHGHADVDRHGRE